MNILATFSGALFGLGLWAVVTYWVPTTPRLGDALERLASTAEVGASIDPPWHRANTPSPQIQRQLRLLGRSPERHFSYKLFGALTGLVLATLLGGALALIAGAGLLLPAAAGLGFALIGYVLPDLRLRSAEARQTQDATESLLTYFDLVTLERLANRSGSQALRTAAAMSDTPVFAAIRDALERSRLEQRAPYDELRRLGQELELPALVDLAEVMALDEAGASLATALRARVRELRDAHLTEAKIAAAAVSERLGIFMVIPSLVFGLIFLVPPILRLLEV